MITKMLNADRKHAHTLEIGIQTFQSWNWLGRVLAKAAETAVVLEGCVAFLVDSVYETTD